MPYRTTAKVETVAIPELKIWGHCGAKEKIRGAT